MVDGWRYFNLGTCHLQWPNSITKKCLEINLQYIVISLNKFDLLISYLNQPCCQIANTRFESLSHMALAFLC